MEGAPNAWITAASALLIAASAGWDAASGPPPGPAALPEGIELVARLTGHVVSFDPPAGFAVPPIDAERLRLVVNGGPPTAPLTFSDHLTDATPRLSLRFLAGAGEMDDARLVLADDDDDGSAEIAAPLRLDVATPPDMFPGPRWGASVVEAGNGILYVLGGAVSPTMVAASQPGEWQGLDSIVRVDLGTGEVRTMGARLPVGVVVAPAVWDPRPSPDCPNGCAFILGGLADGGAEQTSILRYDPTSDVVTRVGSLPEARYDVPAIWSGAFAYVIGGGTDVFRFDPIGGRVTRIPQGPHADVISASAIFDARRTLACPAGCAYIVGGRTSENPGPPEAAPLMQRDVILRFDPVREIVSPTPARLPTRLEAPSVAWDGETAYVLGGRFCTPDGCDRSSAVVAFDPATMMVETRADRVEARPEQAPAVWHEGKVVLVSGKTNDGLYGAFDRLVRVDIRS